MECASGYDERLEVGQFDYRSQICDACVVDLKIGQPPKIRCSRHEVRKYHLSAYFSERFRHVNNNCAGAPS